MNLSRAQRINAAQELATPFIPKTTTSRLNLRFSERKLLLSFVDLSLVFLSFLAIVLPIIQIGQPALFGAIQYQEVVLIYGIILLTVWLCTGFSMGLYNLTVAASVLKSIRLVIGTMAVLLVSLLAIIQIERVLALNWVDVLSICALGTILLISWRLVYAICIAKWGLPQSVVVVGAGESGSELASMLRGGGLLGHNEHHDLRAEYGSIVGYKIIGFIDDDPQKQDSTVAGISVLGGSSELVQIVNKYQPDQVVLAITNTDSIQPGLLNVLVECRSLGFELTTMPELYETVMQRIPINHIGTNIGAALSNSRSGISRLYEFCRRLLDILIGLQGCIMMIPMLPVIWIINRIYAPGPLFYLQERTGKSGKPFQIVKFRSMIVDAEKFSGAVWAEEDDPRITPVGKFLRQTRLDELPQFWNILKGEMSIIGPRPERPHFVELLSEQIPFYKARHSVKPGLTGWAQVQYSYTSSVEDTAVKLQYDLFYIKYQGLVIDTKILLKTIGVVIGFKGR
ncbi:MAG: sugar transferase [Chloroflexota bacterium]